MHRILRLIVLIFGWLLVAAFAGAYAAYYVPPTWIWWLQVLGLALPVITVLLVPITVAAFLVPGSRLRYVLLAALVLVALRHAPFGLLDHEELPTGVQPMRILTYNTHGGSGYAPGGDNGVLDLVENQKPDIICLQEFGAEAARAQPGTAARALSTLGYRQVTRMPEGRRETKRPILTRYAVKSSEHLSLAPGHESYAVRALLQGDAAVFSVYNVHLRGFSAERPWRGEGSVLHPGEWLDFFRTSGGAYVARTREAMRLREILSAEEHPFLVCGDLNSTSNQWAYQHLAADLQDAFQVAGDGWGKTYHTRIPIVRIDYVLASSHWQILSAEVMDATASDHRALVADVSLRSAIE